MPGAYPKNGSGSDSGTKSPLAFDRSNRTRLADLDAVNEKLRQEINSLIGVRSKRLGQDLIPVPELSKNSIREGWFLEGLHDYSVVGNERIELHFSSIPPISNEFPSPVTRDYVIRHNLKQTAYVFAVIVGQNGQDEFAILVKEQRFFIGWLQESPRGWADSLLDSGTSVLDRKVPGWKDVLLLSDDDVILMGDPRYEDTSTNPNPCDSWLLRLRVKDWSAFKGLSSSETCKALQDQLRASCKKEGSFREVFVIPLSEVVAHYEKSMKSQTLKDLKAKVASGMSPMEAKGSYLSKGIFCGDQTTEIFERYLRFLDLEKGKKISARQHTVHQWKARCKQPFHGVLATA